MKKSSPTIINTHATIRWEEGRCFSIPNDYISPEVPLAMRLVYGAANNRKTHDLVVTMRSPGQDKELALGYLFSEGIIGKKEDVNKIHLIDDNQLNIHLQPNIDFNHDFHSKSSFANSACGLCSKTNLEQLDQTTCYFPSPGFPIIRPTVLNKLSEILYQQQSLFKLTGGMHAAALFDTNGRLILSHEDVGRHNALDKLLGCSLQQGQLPWRDKILLMSSRLSYELVQKAAMAGTPILAALGAPTSLALEMAEQSGMTLIAFLRADRFNIYTYAERIESATLTSPILR